MAFPIDPPIVPMLAKLSAKIPEVPLLFEPKWDGFRVLVFRNADEVYLQSRDSKPLLRYFPELREPLLEQLPDRVVLDGELVIASDGSLDFDALQLRLHPAKSRIELLAQQTPASIVLWDVLALGDEDLRATPFHQRRTRLEALLFSALPPLFLTPITSDRATAADWFERFEGAGLDGLIGKDPDGVYLPGKRAMVKIKHSRTVDCAVAGFRWHKRSGVGSLILALFDDEDRMRQIGVCSGFSKAFREQLTETLEPLRDNALDDHPWAEWADGTEGRPVVQSRWNRGRDRRWEPLRLERSVEVRYNHFSSGRLRHPAKFARWRADREPRDCRFDQLVVAPPVELSQIFGASSGLR